MGNDKLLLEALSAGAAAIWRPNINHIPITKQGIHDAYAALKDTLRRRYPGVTQDLLDIAPDQPARQAVLVEQLQKSGAVQDAELQEQARQLLQEIYLHYPDAAAAVDLDLSQITPLVEDPPISGADSP